MTFSEKLFMLRKKEGMSQEELAEKLSVSRQAVSRWEMGSVMPDCMNLLQISKLFGVTTDYLLNDECENVQKTLPETRKENIQQAEQNRRTALVVLVGLQALAFFWGLMGRVFLQSDWVVLLGITLNLIGIIGFEAGFHIQRHSVEQKEATLWHMRYYRISVWFFAYLPIRMAADFFWSLWPGPHFSLCEPLSAVCVYVLVCGAVALGLRRKSRTLLRK